jgi:activator of HSP90 ATPase
MLFGVVAGAGVDAVTMGADVACADAAATTASDGSAKDPTTSPTTADTDATVDSDVDNDRNSDLDVDRISAYSSGRYETEWVMVPV